MSFFLKDWRQIELRDRRFDCRGERAAEFNSLRSGILRSLSAGAAESPIMKYPVVALTTKPASAVPWFRSACFIHVPGTLNMPPSGKFGGSLKRNSMVWLEDLTKSALRRSLQITSIL